MYAYRIGMAIMIAAVYAMIWGAAGDIGFLIIGSLIAVVAGLILAIGSAGSAKYDEEHRHRELLEALGKTDTDTESKE